MPKPVKFNDWEMKVSFTVGQVHRRYSANGDRKWWEGNVATPHGLVGVLTSPPSFQSKHGLSHFRFVYNGRLHSRTYKKEFTQIGLARKAVEFAEDVVGS